MISRLNRTPSMPCATAVPASATEVAARVSGGDSMAQQASCLLLPQAQAQYVPDTSMRFNLLNAVFPPTLSVVASAEPGDPCKCQLR